MDNKLSGEQRQRIAELTQEELMQIDTALSGELQHEWRKAAQIVGLAMMSLRPGFKGVPDVFFGSRLRQMAESGLIEVRGSFASLGTTEVRLPHQK